MEEIDFVRFVLKYDYLRMKWVSEQTRSLCEHFGAIHTYIFLVWNVELERLKQKRLECFHQFRSVIK